MNEVPTKEDLLELLSRKDDWDNSDKDGIFDALQALGFYYYRTEKILEVDK